MTITFLRYVISRIVVIGANAFNQFNWSCSSWTLYFALEFIWYPKERISKMRSISSFS